MSAAAACPGRRRALLKSRVNRAQARFVTPCAPSLDVFNLNSKAQEDSSN